MVSDSFSEMAAAVGLGQCEPLDPSLLPSVEEIERAALNRAFEHSLAVVDNDNPWSVLTSGGLQSVYGIPLADKHDPITVAEKMVDFIAQKHGHGVVKCFKPFVHVVVDDDTVYSQTTSDGRKVTRMRCWYVHEPV